MTGGFLKEEGLLALTAYGCFQPFILLVEIVPIEID
jgi:hypothetical protein